VNPTARASLFEDLFVLRQGIQRKTGEITLDLIDEQYTKLRR
jgi:hypothetical protein